MKRIGLLQSYSYKSPELFQAVIDLKQSLGFEIETIDNFKNYESIVHAVWGLINLVDILMVYVSKEDANTYYEIGLAHGAGKPVIIITEDEFNLPADLRGQRIISIDKNTSSEKNLSFRLKEAINQIEKKGSRFTGFKGPKDELPNYSSSDFHPDINFRDIFAFDKTRRGYHLEKWFISVAESINGWEVISSNSRKDDGFDVVIWNSIEDVELNMLGNPIAVEIKSISQMNVGQLNEFLRKTRKSGLKGLIFATSSLNSPSIKRTFDRLRQEEGINAIALDREDLVKVKTPDDLVKIIKIKLRELLYGEDF